MKKIVEYFFEKISSKLKNLKHIRFIYDWWGTFNWILVLINLASYTPLEECTGIHTLVHNFNISFDKNVQNKRETKTKENEKQFHTFLTSCTRISCEKTALELFLIFLALVSLLFYSLLPNKRLKLWTSVCTLF